MGMIHDKRLEFYLVDRFHRESEKLARTWLA